MPPEDRLLRAADDPPAVRRWTQNPFYVLDLPVDATWRDVERRADDLRVALYRDETTAKRYDTPAGPRRRDRAAIDAALDALRDPDERLIHEVWAVLVAARTPDGRRRTTDRVDAGWPDAMRAFGWRSS